MMAKLHASVLSIVLTVWSTLVLAQTAPGGATSTGTSSPSGGATAPGAGGDGLNWIWIALIVIAVAGLLFYFLGRRRGGTRI